MFCSHIPFYVEVYLVVGNVELDFRSRFFKMSQSLNTNFTCDRPLHTRQERKKVGHSYCSCTITIFATIASHEFYCRTHIDMYMLDDHWRHTDIPDPNRTDSPLQ